MKEPEAPPHNPESAALKRLPSSPRKRVLFIKQRGARGCGPACLAMVLRYHGREASLEEVMGRVAPVPGGGSRAFDLLEAARSYGLRAWGVHLPPPAQFAELGRPSVLHWRPSHFVVLEACGPKQVVVVDPAFGRRRFSVEQAQSLFYGTALCFSDDGATS